MHTPDESKWIATPQSTDIGVKQDGSYGLQGDSGFHSITPGSVPSIPDTQFQPCPGCHNEFEISLNTSSDVQTPGTNKFVGKLCHRCVKGRKLVKKFSHSESPFLVPFRSTHLLGHNDSKTVSLCTPGSSDVSVDTSLYVEEEMETDIFPMEMDTSSFRESSENNIVELKYDDSFMCETFTPGNYIDNVSASASTTTGAKKKVTNFTCEKFSKSPQKNKNSKTRFEPVMIRDLPRRRENRQSRVKGKQSMFRNKYFQPIPIVTSFVGLENIDILYQLQQAQLGLIISNIFKYVEDGDLVSIMRVSKTWKDICCNDHAACKRIRKIPERNAEEELCFKENLYFSRIKQRSIERTIRGQLLQITNHQASPPKLKPPQPMSPHRNSWRYLALSENERVLSSNEKMMSCPRCRNPANDPRNGMPVKCSRVGCQYEFCSICKAEYREGHTCILLSTPRSRKYPPIGSVASKRNLRRL